MSAAATTQDVLVSDGIENVPVQMRGSATELPSLVESAVTATPEKAGTPRRSTRPPKGALAPDSRDPGDRERAAHAVAEREPAGRQDKADAYEATTTRAGVAAGGGCTIDCVEIFNVYPQQGSLVSTLTPLMTASSRIYGQINGGVAAQYSFKLHCGELSTAVCAESGLSQSRSWQTPAGKLEWGKKYCVEFIARYSDATEDWESSCFITGIRQPVVASTLGQPGPGGRAFEPLAGNYTTSATDAQVPAAGPSLTVNRWYNSLDPRRTGIFGAGWSTRWDMRIQRETSLGVASLLVTYPQGQVLRFVAKGDGGYQAPPGVHATLADVAAGGWRLMDKSSTIYTFDAQGRLQKITDARGRTQDLVYTGTGLSKVTATGGRSLTFAWNGAHVGSVSTDPVDGSPLTWTYHYDGDKLTKVCSPAEAPNCTIYSYTTGSQYKNRVLDTDPIGYWRLDETGTGTQWEPPQRCYWDPDAAACQPPATDAARDLTGVSGTARYFRISSRGRPSPLSGTTNGAVQLTGFDEDAQYLVLPRNAMASRHTRMSVEMWFKTTGAGVLLSGKDTGDSPGYGGSAPLDERPVPAMLYVGTDGKLRGQLYRGATPANVMTTSRTVNDGQWHHLVLTGDGPKETIYLDGQSVATRTGSQPSPQTWLEYARVGVGDFDQNWPAAPSPGQYAYVSFYFRGDIDEVALYDKALSPDEIVDHYAARGPALNLLDKITLPSGRVRAQNTYDTATDRLKTHTDQHGGLWSLSEPVYDKTTQLSRVTVTDPTQQNAVKYDYDAWRGYRLAATVDQLEYKTTYEYDTGGYLNKVTDANNNSTTWANDSRGNVLSTTTCRGSGDCQTARSEFSFNKDDPFDARNDRVTKVRDGRSASANDNTYLTSFEYNTYGDLTKQTTPATLDFPNGRSTTIAYTDGTEAGVGGGTTPAGLVKTRTDAKGNATTFGYSAAGDLAEQTDPSGLVTKFEHDALGRVSAQTQISDAEPGGVKTTFTYDKLSRVATQTAPGVKNEISGVTHTAKTSYTYDPDGNTLTATVSDLTGSDPARTMTYTYDAYGHQETGTNPEGGVVRTSWDKLGLQATVTDELGSVFGYTYTKRGQLATRTLKNWTGSPVSPQPAKEIVLESFSYDPGGRLSARVDAIGRKTSYTYFGDDRLSQVVGDDVKLNGSTTTKDVVLEANTYDAAGNLVKQVTGLDPISGVSVATTDYIYDAASRLTSATLDPAKLKRKSAYEYDANGLTTKETRTGAGSTREETSSYAYNAAGIRTRQTIENGDQDLVTTWTIDDRGLTTAITDPRGNADGATKADFTTEMRYDALGRMIEATGPQVKVDRAGTAADAHPTAHFGYDTLGAKTHETDAEGRTVTSAFDKVGRLTSRRAPNYTPPGGTALTPATSYAYDDAGQLISTTDPRGYTTTFDYDKLGRQVRVTDPAPDGQLAGTWVTEYDLAGEKLATVDPNGARSEATYDDLGRRITATQIERRPATASYTTTMEYDNAGRLLKQTTPGGKATSYTLNAAGQVTTMADPLTNKTTMDYDLAGRLIKATDPNGNATTAEYDLAGRKTAAKDLNAGGTVQRTFGYRYDAAGNQISVTSPEGHVTKQTFDALNRATSLVEPVSSTEQITTSFGYDAAGARTRLTDGRGNATWTSYNSLGLVETVAEASTTAHPNPADRTWTQIYDKAGNQVATIQPGGVRVDRTFDHLGRLTKESGAGSGATSAERTFGYDLAGRPVVAGDLTVDFNDRGLPLKVSRGSTQETAYSYDDLGNPTQRTDAAGTATFTWDNASRLQTTTDPVTGRTLTYGYDPASRLKTITATSGAASTQTIDYDDMDRVTGQTLKNGSGTQLAKITYGWDKDDNLTAKTTAGTAGSGANTYGYDHAGRLTSWTAPSGAVTAYEWDAAGNRTKAGNATFTYDERNRLTNGDGTDYTYTPRGTLATSIKAGATTKYTFDAFDRLIADGDSLYSYDALNRMTSRIRGTAKHTFAYSGLGNDLAAITDSGGTVQAKYARDPAGGLLGLKEGTGAAVAALSDLRGDLVAAFTTSLQTSTAYDPFGTVIAQTGTKTGLGYQGEYTDPDTGKVNMHARWYQPGTGTFTSRDTAGLSPSPSVQSNRYTYANASPLTGTDPTGRYTVIDNGSISGSGYGGSSYFGSSGYTTIPAGGYNSSWSSGGGQCIGSCGREDIGGGAIACMIWGCGGAIVDPSWVRMIELQNEMKFWLGEDEIKRLGMKVMPNGRPVPKRADGLVIDFWDASEEAQNDFMSRYDPGASDKALGIMWAVTAAYYNQYPTHPDGCYITCAEGPPSNDKKTAMHRAAEEFARHWAKVKGPKWTTADAARYAAGDKARLIDFKKRWVAAYKDVIGAAAAYWGIPSWVLGAVAYNEVGGDPAWVDSLAFIKRAGEKDLKAALDTSFGEVQMQLDLAATLLGYNDKGMTVKEVVKNVLDVLQNTASNLFIVAYYLGRVHNAVGGQWTDQEVQRVGAWYNGGSKYWNTRDAQAYGKVMVANKNLVKGLLGENPCRPKHAVVCA
ncbi:RHS repeat-associated core domain-containing protein [Nonomuraea sp. NPDC004186]